MGNKLFGTDQLTEYRILFEGGVGCQRVCVGKRRKTDKRKISFSLKAARPASHPSTKLRAAKDTKDAKRNNKAIHGKKYLIGKIGIPGLRLCFRISLCVLCG
jgi:hypothetical protein